MAKGSDTIKIGFDYRASLGQFEKETNGVFDGISAKAGKQRISIQLDAKNDKVIEKIKELQKLKLDKFTFEFGESGLTEQLRTFDQLEKKINEIINLSKGINDKNIGSCIGNSIIDEKSLNNIINLFEKMETHLGEIKKVFVDVGDGIEFSPLLSTIDKINTSISELSTSTKKIGLNMNINVGSDSEAETKVQSKISNALQAYQRLFDHIKMSSAGGSIINTNFFEFDIEQYDTMMGKLQAYKKFIDNMRKEAKTMYNGQDVLYQDTDKSYWNAASAAMGQVTRAFNEMNTSSNTSPLENVFGRTDLSEVISQLESVINKLDEISVITSNFKDLFNNGVNVNSSIEEIEKLTNRVKELEDELSKVKINPAVDSDKSNILSGNSSTATSAIGVQNKLQEELKQTQKQAEKTTEGIFVVFRGLKSSTDEFFDTKNQSAWFSDSLESAKSFARYSNDNLYKASIKIDNPMIVDANGADHDNIIYADTVEELQKAIQLQEELNKKRKEFGSKYGDYLETQDESYLDDVSKYLKAIDEIDALEEKLNSYIKTSEELQKIAKDNGHDGLIIKNVNDNFLSSDHNIGTSYAVFDKKLILSSELLKEQEVQAEKTSQAIQGTLKSNSAIKDVFQNDSNSSSTAKEEASVMEQVESATEKVTESIKKENVELENQLKILSQVGEFYTDKTVKQTLKQNDGQIIARTYRQKMEKDDEGKSHPVFDDNDNIVYDEGQDVVISNFEKLEKTIVNADNALRKMEDTKQEILKLDQNASTSFIDKQIEDQQQYIALLEETIKKISEVKIEVIDELGNASLENVYDIDPKSIQSAREKAAREYILSSGIKQEKSDAKQSAANKKQQELKIEKQITEEIKKQNAEQQKKVEEKEHKDHNYWQGRFSDSIKDLSGENKNSVLDDMREYYQVLEKESAKVSEQKNKEIQKVWEDNLKAITDYMDAKTELNNLEASDKKSNKKSNAIADLTQEVEKAKVKAEEARIALSSMVNPHDVDIDTWDKWLKMMKDFRQAGDGSSKSIAKLKDAISNVNASRLASIQTYIDSAQNKLNTTSKSRLSGDQSSEFKNYIENYQKIINKILAEKQRLENALASGDIKVLDKEALTPLKNLQRELYKAELGFKTLFKGSTEKSRQKEIDKISKQLKNNSKYSEEAKEKLRGFINELKNNGADADVGKIHTEFLKVVEVERMAGREGKSFIDILKNKAVGNFAAQLVSYYLSWTDMIRYAKEGINTVRELDTALTEMRKVSDESVQSLKNYQSTTFDVANEIGTTAIQIQNSTADWMRLGYSIQEASELAKNSNIYKNVGDMEIEEATEHMISSVQAWKSEFNDNVIDTSKAVIDRYNKIGNEFAISSADIGEAMETSAAALKAGGNSLNESLGILTAANIIQQDASTTSGALKILSLRIRGRIMPPYKVIYMRYALA